MSITGLTNNGDASPISRIKMIVISSGRIIIVSASWAKEAFSERGCPRKTIPNAFVKQKTASPPVRIRPVMADNKTIAWLRSAADRLLNIPIAIRYSEIKPLNGGSPQIASEPVRKSAAV